MSSFNLRPFSSASTTATSLLGTGGVIFDLARLSFHVPLNGLSEANKLNDIAKTTANIFRRRTVFPPQRIGRILASLVFVARLFLGYCPEERRSISLIICPPSLKK